MVNLPWRLAILFLISLERREWLCWCWYRITVISDRWTNASLAGIYWPGEVTEVTIDMRLTDKLTINCYGMEIKILPGHWNSVNYRQNWILSVYISWYYFSRSALSSQDLTPEKPQMSPNWTKLRPNIKILCREVIIWSHNLALMMNRMKI